MFRVRLVALVVIDADQVPHRLRAAEKSVFRYYQKLLAIKKTNETAIYGNVEEYDRKSRKIFAYFRSYNGKKLFIIGNFSNKTLSYALPDWTDGAKILINNYETLSGSDRQITLQPYQALVWEK